MEQNKTQSIIDAVVTLIIIIGIIILAMYSHHLQCRINAEQQHQVNVYSYAGEVQNVNSVDYSANEYILSC